VSSLTAKGCSDGSDYDGSTVAVPSKLSPDALNVDNTFSANPHALDVFLGFSRVSKLGFCGILGAHHVL